MQSVTLPRLVLPSCWGLLVLYVGCLAAVAQPPASLDQLPPAIEEGSQPDSALEILTRGPVHEAFAAQVSAEPEPGVTVNQPPPPSVEEIPPDVKPDGSDVAWIPGYWFWDDEQARHLWISGIWRRVPPDRRWVPGYWQQVTDGHQWVSGFWAPAKTSALEYVESPPPETLEIGPSSRAPSTDHFWVPGSWMLVTDNYRWRPGYWHASQDDWIWVSSRFVWTPRGCVFIKGYWDYPLDRRGCLFAPVRFNRPIYLQSGYRYRPSCWIGYQSLLVHLFVRPQYGHYYFGDYYAPIYRQRNYHACHSYFLSHRGFDPLYTFYQHRYRRHGIDYAQRVRGWHEYYTRHASHRPAHSWSDQRHRPTTLRTTTHLTHNNLGRSWKEDVRGRKADLKLVPTDVRSRASVKRHTAHVRSLADLRRQTEQFSQLAANSKQRRGKKTASSPPTRRAARLDLPNNSLPFGGPRSGALEQRHLRKPAEGQRSEVRRKTTDLPEKPGSHGERAKTTFRRPGIDVTSRTFPNRQTGYTARSNPSLRDRQTGHTARPNPSLRDHQTGHNARPNPALRDRNDLRGKAEKPQPQRFRRPPTSQLNSPARQAAGKPSAKQVPRSFARQNQPSFAPQHRLNTKPHRSASSAPGPGPRSPRATRTPPNVRQRPTATRGPSARSAHGSAGRPSRAGRPEKSGPSARGRERGSGPGR